MDIFFKRSCENKLEEIYVRTKAETYSTFTAFIRCFYLRNTKKTFNDKQKNNKAKKQRMYKRKIFSN